MPARPAAFAEPARLTRVDYRLCAAHDEGSRRSRKSFVTSAKASALGADRARIIDEHQVAIGQQLRNGPSRRDHLVERAEQHRVGTARPRIGVSRSGSRSTRSRATRARVLAWTAGSGPAADPAARDGHRGGAPFLWRAGRRLGPGWADCGRRFQQQRLHPPDIAPPATARPCRRTMCPTDRICRAQLLRRHIVAASSAIDRVRVFSGDAPNPGISKAITR